MSSHDESQSRTSDPEGSVSRRRRPARRSRRDADADSQSDSSSVSGLSSIFERQFAGRKLASWFNRIPLMVKTGVVVAVPLCFALAIMATLVSDSSIEKQKISKVEEFFSLATFFQDYLEALLVERQATMYVKHDRFFHTPHIVDTMMAARVKTDAAIANLVSALTAMNFDYFHSPEEFQAMYDLTTNLPRHREGVDDLSVNEDIAFQYYTRIVGKALAFLDRYVSTYIEPPCIECVRGWVLLMRITETFASEGIEAFHGSVSGGFYEVELLRDFWDHAGENSILMNEYSSLELVTEFDPDILNTEKSVALRARIDSIRNEVNSNFTLHSFTYEEIYSNYSAINVLYTNASRTMGASIVADLHSRSLSSSQKLTIYLAVLGVILTVSTILVWLLVSSVLHSKKVLQGEIKRRKVTERCILRFFPNEFMGLLSKADVLQVVSGDRRRMRMTSMFACLKNFAPAAHFLGSEDTYDWLVEFVERMGPVIKKNHGFIDKVLSEGLMALFTNPQDALQSALDMQVELDQMNASHKIDLHYPYDMGIGIHVGEGVVGVIGDENHMEGTIVSDSVNAASRLQGLCKFYGCRIIVSEDVLSECRIDSLRVRPLGLGRVVGRAKGIRIFDVYHTDDRAIAEFKDETRADYERGLALYQEGKFDESEAVVNSIVVKVPSMNDDSLQRRINLIHQLRMKPSLDDWQGEDIFHSK